MEVRQHQRKGVIKYLISKVSVVYHRLRQVFLQKVADWMT